MNNKHVYVLQYMNDGYDIQRIIGVYSSYEKAKRVADIISIEKYNVDLRFSEKENIGKSQIVSNGFYFKVTLFEVDR